MRKGNFRGLAWFAASMLFSAPAASWASSSTAGSVVQPMPMMSNPASPGTLQTGGALLFSQAGTRTTPPSCQGSYAPQRWAIDTSTLAGQAAAAALLSAYMAGKQVIVYGTGNCNVYGDTETIAYFVIQP